MELAVVVLSFACVCLSIIVGVFAGTIPYLWHRIFRVESQLAEMDKVVAELARVVTEIPIKPGGNRT